MKISLNSREIEAALIEYIQKNLDIKHDEDKFVTLDVSLNQDVGKYCDLVGCESDIELEIYYETY